MIDKGLFFLEKDFEGTIRLPRHDRFKLAPGSKRSLKYGQLKAIVYEGEEMDEQYGIGKSLDQINGAGFYEGQNKDG